MEAVSVFITAGSREEADAITRALLEARLVACLNAVPGVRSTYWWEGALEEAEEVLLVAHTRAEPGAPGAPQVLAAVRAVHSYQVFQAFAVPFVACNPDYLQWIDASTPPASAPSPPSATPS